MCGIQREKKFKLSRIELKLTAIIILLQIRPPRTREASTVGVARVAVRHQAAPATRLTQRDWTYAFTTTNK